MERIIRDPRHGVALPAGTGLARAVAALLRRQRDAAIAGLRRGAVAVPPVDDAAVEALLPFFVRYWRQGAQATATRLRSKSARGWRKNIPIAVGGFGFGGFDVFSPLVLAAIRQMVFAFLDEFNDGTADLLRRALAESLSAGETGKDLQRRLVPVFGVGRAFTVGVTECLPGDTLLVGANVNGAYRRWYSGPMCKVVTENGIQITGTPNHPVLTAKGWLPLDHLTKADYLVGDCANIQLKGVTGNVDEQAPPATFDQVFDSLSAIAVRSRQRTGKPDFHGDGREGYVDVLDANDVLRYGRLASAKQLREQFGFASADVVHSVPISRGDMLPLGFMVSQPDGFDMPAKGHAAFAQDSLYGLSVCLELSAQRNETFAGLVASDYFSGGQIAAIGADESAAGEAVQLRCGTRPDGTGISTDFLNRGRIASHECRDGDGAFASHVKLYRVKSLIRRENWSGHVYNLRTEDGYYNANGLYTKNSSRAVHAGQLAAAKESGVAEGKTWLASADACDRCLALDGKTVGLDEPFIVLPGGGPYAVVMHPGLHPHCFCTMTIEV